MAHFILSALWRPPHPHAARTGAPSAQAPKAPLTPPPAQSGAVVTPAPSARAEGQGPSAMLKDNKHGRLPQHRIYHALGNSSQLLGCDRELFLINLLVAAALIFLSHSMVVFALTTPVALLLFLGLHHMGKRDLLLRHVFIRQLHYHHFYQAQAGINCLPSKRY